MNVLVTGSSGQIGTNLALALQARSHRVLGVDKRPNAWTDKFPTQVEKILIRDVSPKTRDRAARALKSVPKNQWQLFESPTDLP